MDGECESVCAATDSVWTRGEMRFSHSVLSSLQARCMTYLELVGVTSVGPGGSRVGHRKEQHEHERAAERHVASKVDVSVSACARQQQSFRARSGGAGERTHKVHNQTLSSHSQWWASSCPSQQNDVCQSGTAYAGDSFGARESIGSQQVAAHRLLSYQALPFRTTRSALAGSSPRGGTRLAASPSSPCCYTAGYPARPARVDAAPVA